MIENIEKEKLNVNKLVGKKRKNVVVEGDIIVPDVKPDIVNVINQNANYYTYKREVSDNKVRINGNINLYIVYLSSEGGNRCLNTVLDLSESVDFENVNSEMNIEEFVTIKSIDAKILNERKINVKVSIEIEIKLYNNSQIEFINNFDELDDIKVLEENINILSLKSSSSARASAKENISIDAIDEIVEIFKVDVSLVNKETKNSYNKILAKADVDLKIMYLTEDDRINVVNASIPIMGFVDMDGITDNDICKINYNMRNLLVSPNSKEDHSIYVEIEYDIFAEGYEQKDMNIAKDMYSLKNDITFTSKNVKLVSGIENRILPLQIRENIELQDVNQIYDTECKAYILNKKVYENKISFDGEIEINFLYETSSSNTLNTKIIKIPFNKVIDSNKDNEIDLKILIKDNNFIVNSNNIVDCILDCECVLNGENEISIDLIDDINIEECNDEYCSMVIYFIKPKDTIWNIAKQFKSTVEDIKFMNNIEDESSLKQGEKLYISRCK